MKTRQEKRLIKPVRYEGGIPQYSLGGILAQTASGAGMGALSGGVAGGLGAVPGAIIGGVAGLGMGLYEHFKERKLEKAEEKENMMLSQRSASLMQSSGSSVNPFLNPWEASKGGIVGGSKVKIRSKELLIKPNLKTVSSEKKGAVRPVDDTTIRAEDGTVIVSPENTPEAKAIARRQKSTVEKLNKILNDPKATQLAKRSAERRIKSLRSEYDSIILADAQKRVAEGGSPTGGNTAGAGWIQGAQLIADLAPMLYNVAQGSRKVEKLDPAAFQNPLAYQALDSMKGRRPILDPALQAADSAVAVGEQNLRGTATGRGQYMSGRTALGNAAMGTKAGIYAQGSQEYNRYLGELGGMQANIGQKMADTNLIVSDLNSRNEAARRNYGAAAAGQLSQWSQVQQQMANQKSHDAMLMEQMRGYMNLFGVGNKNQQNVNVNLTNTNPNFSNTSAYAPQSPPKTDSWALNAGSYDRSLGSLVGSQYSSSPYTVRKPQADINYKNNWTWPQ